MKQIDILIPTNKKPKLWDNYFKDKNIVSNYIRCKYKYNKYNIIL